MTLTEFLLARIAEDEAVARAAIERDGDHWATESLGHDGSRINGTVDKGNPRAYSGSPELWDDEGALGMRDETAAHIARWDPARVLAECEAKRRIVELHEDGGNYSIGGYGGPVVTYIACSMCGTAGEYDEPWPCGTLRLLALPYVNHPDYQEEWRP